MNPGSKSESIAQSLPFEIVKRIASFVIEDLRCTWKRDHPDDSASKLPYLIPSHLLSGSLVCTAWTDPFQQTMCDEIVIDGPKAALALDDSGITKRHSTRVLHLYGHQNEPLETKLMPHVKGLQSLHISTSAFVFTREVVETLQDLVELSLGRMWLSCKIALVKAPPDLELPKLRALGIDSTNYLGVLLDLTSRLRTPILQRLRISHDPPSSSGWIVDDGQLDTIFRRLLGGNDAHLSEVHASLKSHASRHCATFLGILARHLGSCQSLSCITLSYGQPFDQYGPEVYSNTIESLKTFLEALRWNVRLRELELVLNPSSERLFPILWDLIAGIIDRGSLSGLETLRFQARLSRSRFNFEFLDFQTFIVMVAASWSDGPGVQEPEEDLECALQHVIRRDFAVHRLNEICGTQGIMCKHEVIVGP